MSNVEAGFRRSIGPGSFVGRYPPGGTRNRTGTTSGRDRTGPRTIQVARLTGPGPTGSECPIAERLFVAH